MKEGCVKDREKRSAADEITLLPEFITCPKCGFDIELWSDEEQTACVLCGHRVFKREATVH